MPCKNVRFEPFGELHKLKKWAFLWCVVFFSSCNTINRNQSKTSDYQSFNAALDGVYLRPDAMAVSKPISLKINEVISFSSPMTLKNNVKIIDISAKLEQIKSKSKNDLIKLYDTSKFSSNRNSVLIKIDKDKIEVQKSNRRPTIVKAVKTPLGYKINAFDFSQYVSQCPIESDTIKQSYFFEWVVKNSGLDPKKTKVVLNSALVLENLWNKNGFKGKGSCFLALHDGTSGVELSLIGEIQIAFPSPVFLWPEEPLDRGFFLSDLKDPVLRNLPGGKTVESDALALSTIDIPKSSRVAAARFDLKEPIIVDDIEDARGDKLSVKGRETLMKILKPMIAGLNRDFPQLGNKIIFRSTKPTARPQIVFLLGVMKEAQGVVESVVSDENGIYYRNVINLWDMENQDWKEFALELKKLNLIDNVEEELKRINEITVVHEFGHALGLRHNFSGVYLNQDGQPVIASIMGYPFGLPLTFIGIKPEFYPHDIATLKFIYADMVAPQIKSFREESLLKASQFRFSTDFETKPEDLSTSAKKAVFMEKLATPRMLEIKAKDPKVVAKYNNLLQTYLRKDL